MQWESAEQSGQGMKEIDHKPRVEFLWFQDCPNHEVARQLVLDVIAETGAEVEFRDIDASDPATAQALHFPGSPTVRVDGRDVDPHFTDPGDYTPRCRLYRHGGRTSGVPDRAWIEQALAR